jgi:hypothetical protein
MSSVIQEIDASGVVYIQAQSALIGCEGLPNATPVHKKKVAGFWIDMTPLSFAHYEMFVASRGYFETKWWCDSDFDGRKFLVNGSIDQRCRQLRESSEAFNRRLNLHCETSIEFPLIGLNWMEASAVCRFFGGRLPFEFEWEIAMSPGPSVRQPNLASVWNRCRLSQWGCKVTTSFLQEWTASPFQPNYWRVDVDHRGEIWNGENHRMGASIRGSSTRDLHHDHRFRQPGDPLSSSGDRSFRRVWDRQPASEQLTVSFLRV